jgi:hypothetical protein
VRGPRPCTGGAVGNAKEPHQFSLAKSDGIVSRVTIHANWLMDTSSLVALSQSPDLLARFEQRGKDADVTVPSAALDELFAAPSAEQLLGAAALLLRLGRTFDDRLRFAKPHTDLWLAEYRAPLSEIPLIAPDTREAMFGQLEKLLAGSDEAVDNFDSVRSVVKGWKERRKFSSKQIVQRAREIDALQKLRPLEVKTALETSFGIETVEEEAEKLLRHFCSAGDDWREIWRADGRLPALKVHCGLTWLAKLAEALPKGFGEPDGFFEMMCRNRNDFFDATVASIAGYGTHFVTEDGALAKRCSFLRLRGFLDFEAISLNELTA